MSFKFGETAPRGDLCGWVDSFAPIHKLLAQTPEQPGKIARFSGQPSLCLSIPGEFRNRVYISELSPAARKSF